MYGGTVFKRSSMPSETPNFNRSKIIPSYSSYPKLELYNVFSLGWVADELGYKIIQQKEFQKMEDIQV